MKCGQPDPGSMVNNGDSLGIYLQPCVASGLHIRVPER